MWDSIALSDIAGIVVARCVIAREVNGCRRSHKALVGSCGREGPGGDFACRTCDEKQVETKYELGALARVTTSWGGQRPHSTFCLSLDLQGGAAVLRAKT